MTPRQPEPARRHPLDAVPPPPELNADELLGWRLAMTAARDATSVLTERPLFEGLVLIQLHASNVSHAGIVLGELLRLVNAWPAVHGVTVKAPMQPADVHQVPL